MHRRREKFCLCLALIHLCLVVLGASYVDVSELPFVGSAMTYYGVLSGAGNSYGFFAPGVGAQLRSRFEIVTTDGHKARLVLESGASHEADLRFGNIIDQFIPANEDDDDDLRRSLAASLAGKVFSRHPEAQEVAVLLDEFDPVSMTEYGAGKRASWQQIYLSRFVHHRSANSEVSR